MKTIFFLGKGGTGKSTTSAVLSLMLSRQHHKVALASFDDAHNQGDIFQADFSHKPTRINGFLEVIQVDRDREIKAYLKQTAAQVKKSFAYLTAFNLDHYFDVLKYSPGLEEYGLITAFLDLKKQYQTHDYLIIDMPPTALSMRFFNLPSLSLTWTKQLEKLRQDIHKRKEIVSRIKFAGKEIERDKIMGKLVENKTLYRNLNAFFQDPDQAMVFAVFNRDLLSVEETRRIIALLDDMSIAMAGLVLNEKSLTREPFTNPFPGIQLHGLPFSPVPLIGKDVLEGYITSQGTDFLTI